MTPRRLAGFLSTPEKAPGLVLFAHGSGSSRLSPRNTMVAKRLNEAGVATLLFDLLTEGESADRGNVFDIGLLAGRLLEATAWARNEAGFEALPIGYFGASTGAGAALMAAADEHAEVAAVVSRGGRPDLAGAAALNAVRAPTLLIVGSKDVQVLELNRQALAELRCEKKLEVVSGASHLFEEAGTLERAADLAAGWFQRCFSKSRRA
ncbi:hydrolase [Marinicaulis flavus]|uniref:Hydrolase n=2 Tax=Hyphococcus luteus TaxID=2058213 RepID=A0A2S7KBF3_9PROT|nr:hydrolase [Marinicaulis flavus]